MIRALPMVVLGIFLVACSTRVDNSKPIPSSDSKTNLNAAPDSSTPKPPTATPTPTPFPPDSEPVEEAQRRIDEVFEKCPNGYTYTLADRRDIIEIEDLFHIVVPVDGRPTYPEVKDEVDWVANIVIRSTSSRTYDTLRGCWSAHNSGLNDSFSLVKEKERWKPPFSFPRYQHISCQEVHPYLSANTCQ